MFNPKSPFDLSEDEMDEMIREAFPKLDYSRDEKITVSLIDLAIIGAVAGKFDRMAFASPMERATILIGLAELGVTPEAFEAAADRLSDALKERSMELGIARPPDFENEEDSD